MRHRRSGYSLEDMDNDNNNNNSSSVIMPPTKRISASYSKLQTQDQEDYNNDVDNDDDERGHAPLHHATIQQPQDYPNDHDSTTDSNNNNSTAKTTILTPIVWCILVAETGERFAYFGFRAILVLYFVQALQWPETQAVANYAYVTCLAYFSPLLGALLADGSWGRFQTILYCGVLYIGGLAILTWAAWKTTSDEEEEPDATDSSVSSTLAWQRFWTGLGLVMVCLGTGGIKPCVSAFGADQVAHQQKQKAKQQQQHLKGDNNTHRRKMEGKNSFEEKNTTTTSSSSSLDKDDENNKGQERVVRTFFAYFYFCINVGAVLSIALVPLVRGWAGFGPAFALSLGFMILAMGLFASQRHKYYHHHHHHHNNNNQEDEENQSTLSPPTLSFTLRLCVWLLWQNVWRGMPRRVLGLISWLQPPAHPPSMRSNLLDNTAPASNNNNNNTHDINSNREETRTRALMKEQLSDAAQVLHVLPIFAALPIFWCLYDQQGSVWTLQAKRMELHGLQPEQLNVVNPVEIMLFIPLFEKVIYPAMSAAQWDISPLRRMQWGMVLSAISFVTSGLVESWIEHQASHDLASPSVFWQLPQITILAVGEIFVSVTGLEFAYATAPERVKALIMSLFLLTTAGGNLLSGILYSTVFDGMDRSWIMHICATLMMVNFAAFSVLSRWWLQRDATDLTRVVCEQHELIPAHSEIEMQSSPNP